MSAAIANDRIYDSFRNKGSSHDNTFWHSHTFGGNPIIAALALEAIKVYDDEHVLERSRPRVDQLAVGIAEIASLLPASRWQAMGMMGVVEISDASSGAGRAVRIVRKAYELGLFLRPRGRAVYLWPPLTVTGEELETMLAIIRQSVQMM